MALGSILRAGVRGRRLAQYFGCTAVVTACLLIPSSATAVNSQVLRGFGTATLDGVLGAGEWDAAGRADFTVNRLSSEGGGTVPATIYVMNDAVNLYLGLKVTGATVGRSELEIQFGSSGQEGADNLYVSRAGDFADRFVHQIAPSTWQAVPDTDYGGTTDGGEWEADAAGYSFYEFSHPLNDGDDAHDFSLQVSQRLAFNVVFMHCIANTCASRSYFPPVRGMDADLVVVSGSRVPPDTQLTAGPGEGTMTAELELQFAFTGSDDVLQPSQLTFECKTDDDPWRECTSPLSVSPRDGRHTFSVRAFDEMLNVDQSPAQRTLTVDTTGPSKPIIRGPRSVRTGKRVVLRFSASDELARGVRFRCAFGSARLRNCPAVLRRKLRPGRHIVRVRALDRLGNQSELSTFRVRVKRTRR